MMKLILRDKIIRFSIIASSILFVLLVGLVGYFYQFLPPYIPFFNSLPWGQTRFGIPSYTIAIPLAALFVFSINFFSSITLYNKHTLLARILSLNTLLFVFFACIGYIQITLLVF